MEKRLERRSGQERRLPFRANRALHAMLMVFGGIWLWLAVSPYSRYDWVLENLLIWLALLVLVISYRYFQFTNLSYALMTLFLLFHAVGAHYSYNETFMDPWLKQLFHVQRNPYDRLVHFSYGLLLAYPIRELIMVWAKISGWWTYAFACTIVLATGAFYELIEMWVALLVAPEIGTLFLGTQGDPWDTQHDMELALYGAVLAMGAAALVKRLTRKV